MRLVFENLLPSDQFHVRHVVLLGPLVQSLQSVKLGLVSGDDQLANFLVGDFMAITVLVGGMQACKPIIASLENEQSLGPVEPFDNQS